MSKAAELAKMGEVLTNSQIGGRRNIVINGAMQVAQRATSVAAVGGGNGFITVDRFRKFAGSTSGRHTQSQATITDLSGFAKALKLDCTTADTSISAAEILAIQYSMEGQDLQQLKKGTSDAESVTVSFYVKGNASATYTVELEDGDNSRYNSQEFSVTTSWTRVVKTFVADTTGTLDNDNALSLSLNFILNAGSNFTGGTHTDNVWHTTTNQRAGDSQTNFYDSTDREFFLTGVQLEVGSTATPFEHRSFGEELLLCQRYFVRLSRNDAYGEFFLLRTYDTSNGTCAHHLPVPMRDSPTLETSTVNSSNFSYSLSALSIGHASTNFQNVELFATGSFTANGAAVVQKANNSDVITIDFKAEL